MRATCLTAFHNEIKNRSCDAFYVRITKDLTVDEKRRTLNDSRNYFSDQQKEHPDLSKNKIKLKIIKDRLENMQEIGNWKDKWLFTPFS